jgi:signal peptidase I
MSVRQSPPAAPASPAGTPRHPLVLQLGTAFVWFVVSYLAAMLAWVVVPSLLNGWTPLVVVSGSMAPTILPGDVVLIDPTVKDPPPGAVVAYRTGDGLVTHRVVESKDGSLRTRGDANPVDDSTPVEPSDVIGQGRLLVPYVGYARVATGTAGGRTIGVIGLAALAAGLFALRRRPLLVIVGLVVCLALTVLSTRAAFAAATHNQGSSFQAIELTAPTGLNADCGVLTLGQYPINLSWNAATNAGSHYQILHGFNAPPTNVIATVPVSQLSTTHNVPGGLANLGTHRYAITSIHGGLTSPPSTEDSVLIATVVLATVCLPQ